MVRFLFPAICLLAGFATSCGPAATRNTQQDSLVYGRGGDSVSLDPGMLEDGESFKVAAQIFEGLVRFKDDSLEVEPWLAERYEVAEDGITWTFYLREGVLFHDGTPFDAESVVTSFMRMIDPNHPHHRAGRMPYADYCVTPFVKEVTAIDTHTVQILLHRPYGPFLKTLTMFCFYIVSPQALERFGEDFAFNPVGTGPYKFVSWERNASIELRRNENYWGPPAKTERVFFRSIPAGQVRLFSLERGEINIMDGIEPPDMPLLKGNKELVLHRQPGQNVGFAVLNTSRPPFDNKLVRQALNYAVDKKNLCEHLFDGLAIPAKGVLPPGIPGYDPLLPGYEFDPEKSTALFAQAGYPHGFEIEICTYSIPRPYNPMGTRLAEILQENLARVGVRATIKQMEWAAHLEAVRNHEFTLALIGWMGDNGDPDNFMYTRLGDPNNPGLFHNDRFSQLLAQAQETYDEAQRIEMYQEAERIVVEECPWIFLNHFEDLAVTHSSVRGLRLHPASPPRLWNVWIDHGRETTED
ncbi:MAG: ABC transporter substrate-binding protein [bacterium]